MANIGNTIGFHVAATGTSPSYQWKKNDVALTNGGDFSGVTTPDLSVHVTTPADVGIYTVTVSNLAGSVTSAGAALRVNQTVTNFFDDFETYSILQSRISYGRRWNAAGLQLWGQQRCHLSVVGAIAAQFLYLRFRPNTAYRRSTYPAYSGNQMIGGAYDTVSTSGDNDETFLNLAYRFNGGQLYYGDIMLDYYFYDPGVPDAGDQVSLANFAYSASPPPAILPVSTFRASPVQNLFIGTWPNLEYERISSRRDGGGGWHRRAYQR